MPWLPFATINTSTNWQLTKLSQGSLFRLKHYANSPNITSLRAIIAQAFNDSEFTKFDIRRLSYKTDTESFLFIQPEGLERRLAVKRLDNLSDDWQIQIEVLKESVDLNLPQANFSEAQKMDASKLALKTKTITLLDKAEQDTDGSWIELPPYLSASIVVEGFPKRPDDEDYTLPKTNCGVYCSNAPERPNSYENCTQIGYTDNQAYYAITFPVKWIKATVFKYDKGEISAYLCLTTFE